MKIVLIKHFYVSGGPRLRHVHVPDIMHNILKLMIVKSSQEILQTRKFLSRYKVKQKSTLQRMNFLSRKSKFLSRMIILKFIQFKFIVEFNYMRIVISDSRTLETLYFLYSFLKQETLILCCFKVKYSTMVFKNYTIVFYSVLSSCGLWESGLWANVVVGLWWVPLCWLEQLGYAKYPWLAKNWVWDSLWMLCTLCTVVMWLELFCS